MKKPLAGIIFDLDGTLVDSAPDICNALNTYLKRLGRRPLSLDETKTALGDGAASLLQRSLGLTGDAVGYAALAEHVRAFITLYRDIPADPAQIYPHVTSVLQRFHAGNIDLGLCTNKPEVSTLKLLDDLALSRYFGAVAGGDTFAVRKPDPGHIRGVVERLGAEVSRCVMVGDSINDLLAAQGLNMPCIIVNYGYGNSAALQADAVIDDFSLLPETLTRLGYVFDCPHAE